MGVISYKQAIVLNLQSYGKITIDPMYFYHHKPTVRNTTERHILLRRSLFLLKLVTHELTSALEAGVKICLRLNVQMSDPWCGLP